MKRELVGAVLSEEREKFEALFKRKSSLEELLLALESKDEKTRENELFNKVKNELNEIIEKCNKWWREMGSKYNWKKATKGLWDINLESGKIYLISHN